MNLFNLCAFFINFASACSVPLSTGPHGKSQITYMAKQRILYVSPEITPYLPSSEISLLGRNLPTAMNSRKYEVRTFMPNFGSVNERRNQLHEVIRLSGINIPISDADHPLIIKVASMQPSRIQVYFIDNDDYFQKSDEDEDAVGSNREDNDERIIFFSRGTVDTARKLRWEPDILHASGWIASMVPMYVKTVFSDGTSFKDTKVVYSILDEAPIAPLDPRIIEKLKEDGIDADTLAPFSDTPADTALLHKLGITFADAVVFNNRTPDQALLEFARGRGIPVLTLDPEADNADSYHELYQQLLSQEDSSN